MSETAVLLLKLKHEKHIWALDKEKVSNVTYRGFSVGALVFMGSIDCLTTVVGVLYFRAKKVELNPIIAGIVNTSLPAFVYFEVGDDCSRWLNLCADGKNLN